MWAGRQGVTRLPFIVTLRAGPPKRYLAGFLDTASGRYRTWRTVKDADGRPVRSQRIAWELARRMYQDGVPGRAGAGLAVYLEAFWQPTGQYAHDRADRGQALSAAYLANQRYLVAGHVLPYLEQAGKSGIAIDAVTPDLLRSLMRWIRDRGASARTVNAALQAAAVPLADYWRGRGQPERSPARGIGKFHEPRTEREILTPDEAYRFLAQPWADLRMYAINLLAATTGMRLGECLALRRPFAFHAQLPIDANWQAGEGLKAPKTGSRGVVPLPAITEQTLRRLDRGNPYRDRGQYLFYSRTPERPMGRKVVQLAFNKALLGIGIGERERVKRHLTFHGWRHWYRSMLDAGGISERAGDALTRHRQERTAVGYTHVTAEQRQAVKRLAARVVATKRVNPAKR